MSVIRMVLSAFRPENFSEEEISWLSKSSKDEGTSHKGIRIALKTLGVKTFQIKNKSVEKSLEIIENEIEKGRVIVVEWMKTLLISPAYKPQSGGMKPGVETGTSKGELLKEDNEHYAVIQGVNRVKDKITLMDPLEPKAIRIDTAYFVERWMSLSEKSKRWFIIAMSNAMSER